MFLLFRNFPLVFNHVSLFYCFLFQVQDSTLVSLLLLRLSKSLAARFGKAGMVVGTGGFGG
jgi:hypothetical protein